MKNSFAEYDELVHDIYDAALSPEQWPAVLGAIGRHLGSERGLLFTPFHAPSNGGFSFAHNIPQAMLERWAASGIHDDPMARAAFDRGLVVEGSAFSARELVSDERLRGSRIFREIWEPMGIGHAASGIVFGSTDSRTLPTAVCVYRRRSGSTFNASEIELMRRLMAHMSRSLGVMFHLRDRELRAASSLISLGRLSAGVALIGEAGELQFANGAAEALFRGGRYVVSTPARHPRGSTLKLAPRHAGHEKDFQAAIVRALHPLDDSIEAHFSNAIVLDNEGGRPGCVTHVAPLGRGLAFRGSGPEPKAIAFFYDLGAAATVAPLVLMQLFELTPSEARAALEVVRGGSVQEMADRLGVASNTFKSQLKAVYAKTRTGRHSDLLKLLLALATQ